MTDERLWCADCQRFASPEQETGDCYFCGASCWTSKGAWVARQEAERFVAAIADLSLSERMEAVNSVRDLLCLSCGANRRSDGDPCCESEAQSRKRLGAVMSGLAAVQDRIFKEQRANLPPIYAEYVNTRDKGRVSND